jgi:hypothetical protein
MIENRESMQKLRFRGSGFRGSGFKGLGFGVQRSRGQRGSEFSGSIFL